MATQQHFSEQDHRQAAFDNWQAAGHPPEEVLIDLGYPTPADMPGILEAVHNHRVNTPPTPPERRLDIDHTAVKRGASIPWELR